MTVHIIRSRRIGKTAAARLLEIEARGLHRADAQAAKRLLDLYFRKEIK